MCQCQRCGCSIANGIADAIKNLFSTPCCRCNNGCGCNGNNNGCGCNGNNNGGTPVPILANLLNTNLFFGTPTNGGNGCGCNGNNNGCGCGCGSNGDLSAYTACGNQCYDDYYARQYALYPYNIPSSAIGCSCA